MLWPERKRPAFVLPVSAPIRPTCRNLGCRRGSHAGKARVLQLDDSVRQPGSCYFGSQYITIFNLFGPYLPGHGPGGCRKFR